MVAMTSAQTIFKSWNEQMWKHRHRRLTPDIELAVRYNLRQGWLVEDICEAIGNYAKVLQDKDYTWTYNKWTLAMFLTRGKKEDCGLRWVKHFHPNNFVLDDWLRLKARQQRASVRPEKKPIKLVTAAEKAEIAKNLPFRMQRRK